MRFLTDKELRQTDKRKRKRKKKPIRLQADGIPIPRREKRQKSELPPPRARLATGSLPQTKAISQPGIWGSEEQIRRDLEVLARKLGMKKEKVRRVEQPRKDWKWWERKSLENQERIGPENDQG